MKHVHVVGVAGVGMNPLAQVLRHEGYRVTGSDRFADQGRSLPVLDQLAGMGIEVVPQDGSALQEDSEAVVISTAIEADNPERRRAVEIGVPVLHRAEMLARFANPGRCIAVAGTAGKTTTTGMLGQLLAGELDATVVNGAGLVQWKSAASPGNVRFGASDWWVIEADESDRSCLRFQPHAAIITNIAQDHFSFDESVALFRAFAAQVRRCIVCPPAVRELLAGSTEASFVLPDEQLPERVGLLGAHNLENAQLACAMAVWLGVDAGAAGAALRRFRGIERRLEEVSAPGAGVRVFDDYAHNPGKIGAALAAVQAAVPGRVFALWRPHGYGPLQQNFEAFRDIFRAGLRTGDELLLLPVFYAGGTAGGRIETDALAEVVDGAAFLPDYGAACARLRDGARAGDAVLIMGARDPDLPVVARRVAADLAGS